MKELIFKILIGLTLSMTGFLATYGAIYAILNFTHKPWTLIFIPIALVWGWIMGFMSLGRFDD